MKFDQFIASFAAHLRSAGKKPATISSYSVDVRLFLEYLRRTGCRFAQLEPSYLVSYCDHLRDEGTKESSIRRAMIAIRQYARFLVEAKVLKFSPLDDVPLLQNKMVPAQTVTSEQFEEMTLHLSTPGTLKSWRDLAILFLLGLEGLKVTEVIQLRWKHVLATGQRWLIKITGDKGRNILLQENTSSALRAYWTAIQMAGKWQLLKSGKPVFVGFKGKDATLILPQLTRHGIKFFLYELGEATDIKFLNAERLRHHAMKYLLNSGMGSEQVMVHLGLKQLGNISQHLGGSSER